MCSDISDMSDVSDICCCIEMKFNEAKERSICVTTKRLMD